MITRNSKLETRTPHVTFVIMAGGKGERLWPLSGARVPKTCLSMNGGPSLLRQTVTRCRGIWPRAGWLVVTTQEHAKAVQAELPRALRACVLVEPQSKNTAACITLAAIALARRDPQHVMVVVPADHWIGDQPAFQRAVRAAVTSAVQHDTIATIGVRPSHAHAGLGYVSAGARVPAFTRPRVFRLARFIEKPSLARAQRLIRRAGVYWNVGIFVGTADKFLECVTQRLPDHTQRLVPLARMLERQGGRNGAPARPEAFARRARRAYRSLNAVSFDRGVMDTIDGGLIVEGNFSWADLGSLDVWARMSRARAPVLTVDSERITVLGQAGRLVAAVGVRDLLIVQTPHVTLICDPKATQSVREVVTRLATDPRLSAYR